MKYGIFVSNITKKSLKIPKV